MEQGNDESNEQTLLVNLTERGEQEKGEIIKGGVAVGPSAETLEETGLQDSSDSKFKGLLEVGFVKLGNNFWVASLFWVSWLYYNLCTLTRLWSGHLRLGRVLHFFFFF